MTFCRSALHPSSSPTWLCGWRRFTCINMPWPTTYRHQSLRWKLLSELPNWICIMKAINGNWIFRREFGLERFVPTSLIDGMKRKELRRLVSHFLKLNSQMTGSSTKVLTQLQAKIHYLDIISGLPSYGAKCFSTNQRDGVERVLLVSPRFGLSQIAGSKNSVVSDWR